MKQRKKSFGMRISAFVLSFAMVCTLLAGVNVVAFAAETDDELTDTVSVLRAYNPNNSEHLYTVDQAEYDANVDRGYNGEGEAWIAPASSNTPVYRVYNPNSGEHLLVADKSEYDGIVAAGWEGEGQKMYSDDNKGVPIYRVFNPNSNDAGSHHYCGKEEAQGLVNIGWSWDNNAEPVIYGVYEEPVVIVKLTNAKQLSANSVEVTFDQNANGYVTKDNITVASADGTAVLPINSITFSDDGMSAVLSLAANLADQKDYTVTLNDSESTFTASLGEVASVVVKTSSAVQNEDTEIEFALYDSKGVDVTSTVAIDDTCQVEVDGEDVTADTSRASSATLNMGTVGETAQVTVTYNKGESESVDITGTAAVICIEPEALVGTPLYYAETSETPATPVTYVNKNSKMAKFYWGLVQSDPVSVVVGGTSNTVYWCAGDLGKMEVYSYDEYEITSSDEDIMSVEEIVGNESEGKQVRFRVNGNKVGNANAVIKATKNGKETFYTVPVTVKPEGKLDKISVTLSRTKMSNAIDNNYYGQITTTVYDTNGDEMLGIVPTYTVPDSVNAGVKDLATGNVSSNLVDTTMAVADGSGNMAPGFTLSGNTYTAYASDAVGGSSKTMQVEVSEGEKIITKKVSVSIQKLDNNIWNVTGAGTSEGSVKYKVEMSNSTVGALIKNSDDPTGKLGSGNGSSTVRLAAYVNNVFAGYVYQAMPSGNVTIGTPDAGQGEVATGVSTDSAIKVTTESGIDNGSLKFGVKYGANYATTNITGGSPIAPLYGSAGFVTKAALDVANPLGYEIVMSIDLTNLLGGKAFYDAGTKHTDTYFAKSGTYRPTYIFTGTRSGKAATEVVVDEKLTVNDQLSAMAPRVTVTSRNVDSISKDNIIANMTTLVDMNNNTSQHESITDILDKNQAALNYTGDSLNVGYAVVEDNFAGATLKFYVPIGNTFVAK